MISPNPDRNSTLYRYWEGNKKIEEASLLSGIPRSTVGYYFKKFDNYSRAGKPIPVGAKEGANDFNDFINVFSYMRKEEIQQAIQDFAQKGRLGELRDLFEIFKLTKDLGLTQTKEEAEAFKRAAIQWLRERKETGAPP